MPCLCWDHKPETLGSSLVSESPAHEFNRNIVHRIGSRHGLLVVLISCAALAQGFGGGLRTGVLVGTRTRETTGALTYYVETTGSDGNNCNSAPTPCLTIQGALNKVPKTLRHPTTISVGLGTFSAGAYIDGFLSDSELNDPNSGAFLTISGTLQNATLATGTATGTATSGTAGSVGVYGTMTHTGQVWTINDLKGKILYLTGGTGSATEANRYRVIYSNTATVVTIVNAFTIAPDSSTTYQIADWGTVISGVLGTPKDTNASTGSATSYSFQVGATSAPTSPVTFQRLKFTGTNAIRANASTVTATEINVSPSSTGILLSGGTFSLNRSYLYMSGTSALVSLSDGAKITVANTYFRGNSSGVGVNSSSASRINATSGEFDALTSGVVIGSGVEASLIGTHFHSTTNCIWAGSDIPSAIGSYAASTQRVSLAGVYLFTCGTGIYADTGSNFVSSSGVDGNTNTTIISAKNGASVQINSSWIVTGTTEITIDGTNTTFAVLRAATPKHVKDSNTFSKVWER